jgi:two-component system, NarL family, sensor kinase
MPTENSAIIIFLVTSTVGILLLAGFIITIVYLYQKKQIAFQRNIEEIKANHEKIVLKTQLEIQEKTFQNVSREIHDNIGLSLTLAKLHLNTLCNSEYNTKVQATIKCLTNAIKDLSDLSKSLNSDFIRQNGFLKALEMEIETIQQLGIYHVKYDLKGEPFYLEAHKEIVLFRIVQEVLNNILKHSKGDTIAVSLNFNSRLLDLKIEDNGVGFNANNVYGKKAGLRNIKERAEMLHGSCHIETSRSNGTMIQILIPNND